MNLKMVSEAGVVKIEVTRGISLKSLYETFILVSSKSVDLVETRPHSNVSKRHRCIVARNILDRYPDRLLFVNLTNFFDQDV